MIKIFTNTMRAVRKEVRTDIIGLVPTDLNR